VKVDGSLVSLIQGVSQQPARERLPGQCELQENMSSNPVQGLIRRSPTEYIGDLLADGSMITAWNSFTASDGNKYLAGVGNGVLRLWNLDAQEKTIVQNKDYAYLTGVRPSFETVDQNTFVLDRNRITEMTNDGPLYSMGGGLIWLLGGQYGRTYRITLNFTDGAGASQTVTVTFATPNGGAAADSLAVATENVATQLYTALTGNATFNLSFGATRISDVIYIRWLDANRVDDFDLTVDDGDGGANIFSMTRNIGASNRLPRYAPHRYVVKITGDGAKSADDWYLQFLVGDNVTGTDLGLGFGKDGVWRECTGPFQPHKWNLATMPHVLEQGTGGEFTWGEASWIERRAGDDASNPPPSLLGRTINDLGTFQGRLAMCSGPNVIMSRTDKSLDLWINSATVQAPDDPIDIQSTAKTFSTMRYIVPQNRDLVVFSEEAQFIILGRNALTPTNAALVLTTSFEAELAATPAPSGRNVFFSINYDNYTGVREFYAEGLDDVNDARPITQHISEYIPGKVRQLASTSNFDNLIVLSTGNEAQDVSKALFIYEYLWVDDQKAQSSWSMWSYSDELVYVLFDQNVVYMVMKDSTGRHYLVRMSLSRLADKATTYTVHLDNKVSVENVNMTVAIPYDSTDREMVIVQGEDCPNPGMTVEATWNQNNATLKRDMLGGTVIVGERYLSRYQPTMPMAKDADNVKIGTARLSLKNILISVRKTGYIKVQKLSKYAATKFIEFSGRILGAPDNMVGRPAVSDATVTYPFNDKSDYGQLEICSNSHLPLSILDIEWTGQYTKKGKRMSGG
jgi:hypothetical protein